jgi:2-succinyl-6-hydroxy-2,4-cyclohexadiene-1-carboxylate synthase
MAAAAPVPWDDGLAARATTAPGQNVLWLHGYTMDGTIWDGLWERLPEWRHLGIDLPGHGGSRSLQEGDDLHSLAEKLGNDALVRGVRHLVGLSFGSLVTLEIAACFPDSFDRIVLAAPTFGGAPIDPAAQRLNQEMIRLFKAKGAGPWMTSLWMTSPTNIFTGAARHPAFWLQLEGLVNRHRWLELAGGQMQRLTALHHNQKRLACIQADVLVLVGEDDMPAFRRAAQILARWLPRCRVHYMAEAGHLCLLEQPDSAARLIAAHLRNEALPTES